MNLLILLKDSAFSQWLSMSMAGFPVLIALHSVGMAVAVGMSLIVTMRLCGALSDIRIALVPRLLGVGAAGFLLNFITGIALFITRGPEYLQSLMFLFKMLLVAIGAGSLIWLKRRLTREVHNNDGALAVDGASRIVSLSGTAVFFAAVVAGRLIAYLSDLY